MHQRHSEHLKAGGVLRVRMELAAGPPEECFAPMDTLFIFGVVFAADAQGGNGRQRAEDAVMVMKHVRAPTAVFVLVLAQPVYCTLIPLTREIMTQPSDPGGIISNRIDKACS